MLLRVHIRHSHIDRSAVLVYGGLMVALLMSCIGIISVVGPTAFIWALGRPSGSGIGWLPEAYRAYANQLARLTHMSYATTCVSLAAALLTFTLTAVLAALTAVRRKKAKDVFVVACALQAGLHLLAMLMGMVNSGGLQSSGELQWVVGYATILMVFSRKVVKQYFEPLPVPPNSRFYNTFSDQELSPSRN